MNRSIRMFGLFMMVLFVLLALQLANLQIVQANRFNHDPRNTRQAVADFSRARGAIQTSDGVVVAQSNPSNDIYKYQRVYPHGLEYSFITGFLSFRTWYGATGVEQTYSDDLAGSPQPAAPRRPS